MMEERALGEAGLGADVFDARGCGIALRADHMDRRVEKLRVSKPPFGSLLSSCHAGFGRGGSRFRTSKYQPVGMMSRRKSPE